MKMDFEIFPLKGFGSVKLGSTRDEVLEMIGSPSRSFRRTPQDAFPCDHFQAAGVFIYYDGDGRFEAVEFVSPARPTIADVSLLELNFDEALLALSRMDSELEKEIDGAISHKLGVGIYAPLAKDNTATQVESVIAFRAGYYSEI